MSYWKEDRKEAREREKQKDSDSMTQSHKNKGICTMKYFHRSTCLK